MPNPSASQARVEIRIDEVLLKMAKHHAKKRRFKNGVEGYIASLVKKAVARKLAIHNRCS